MTLHEAKELARKHRCFVVTKPDCYLLFRECEPKNVCVGRRSSVEGILYETKRKEYEQATANANTWRNVL